MFARLSRLLVFLAAVQILGGHWVALQSVAWVGMVADYARESSLSAALGKTFDGAHPCALCEIVKRGQSEEKKQDAARSLLKLEAVLPAAFRMEVPPVRERVEFGEVAGMTARNGVPLVPPPLAA